MKILVFTLLIWAVAFSSCKPKSINDKFDLNNYKTDIKLLNEKKIISDSDKIILSNYLMTNYDTSLSSLTYSLVLSIAKSEKEALDKKIETKKRLNSSINVQITRKWLQNGFDKGFVKTFLMFEMNAENKTNRKISGFTVEVRFKNPEGVAFNTITWPVDKGVDANSKKQFFLNDGEYKNTNAGQAKLLVADLSKLNIEYNILELVYDDGSTLNAK